MWIWTKIEKIMQACILSIELTVPLISFPQPHKTKILKQHEFC